VLDEPHEPPGLGADMLRGARSIADFIGYDLKSTYARLSKGQIPAGKEGELWIASKAVLRAHYARLTNPPPAPPRLRVTSDGLLVPPRRGRPRKVT
jgi:hypothetical protein